MTENFKDYDHDAFAKWLENRPQAIKDLVAKIPPDQFYELDGKICYIYSYWEDGTVSVNIEQEFQRHGVVLWADRQVFDVKPENLKPVGKEVT